MGNFRLFGYNAAITTSTDPEDVIPQGGIFTFPTLATIFEEEETGGVHISSTNDTDEDVSEHGAEGAHQVKITGLNTKYETIIETVTLYGGNIVFLNNRFFRINKMEVLKTGTSLNNVGVIYVGTGGLDGSLVPNRTTLAAIAAGDNQSLSSVYTVPLGRSLSITGIEISPYNIATKAATAVFNWSLKAGPGGFLKVLKKGFEGSGADGNPIRHDYSASPIQIKEKEDMKVTIDSVGGTLGVAVSIDGVLT